MPLDLGNIPGSANRMDHAYRGAVGTMQRTAARAAAEERRTHGYQNRTGDLEASTQASEVISAGSDDVVTLEAAMPYASYVSDRGLMRLESIAEQAGEEMVYLFDGVADAARVL